MSQVESSTNKLKMHTPDLVQNNLDWIAERFPGCITESRNDKGEVVRAVDFDLLRQELSTEVVEGPQERYHINWPGKREALLAANAPIAKTLRPCREESVDFDTTRNLFIEGDNLEALKLLQETYLNQIQLIILDPPYNTGRDFLYRDHFGQTTAEYLSGSDQASENGERLVANPETNGRFHSDWLTMMYPRLKIAWNMLSSDGLLAVMIDDREIFQLGKLLDEIFGPGCCLACAPWLSEASGGKEKTGLRTGHEYVLLYFKHSSDSVSQHSRDTGDLNLQDERGEYRKGRELMKWGGTSLRRDRPNQFYELPAPDGALVFPYRNDGEEGHWRWGRENPEIKLAMQDHTIFHWERRPFDGELTVNGERDRWVPYEKIREVTKSVGWGTWLDKIGFNSDATRELKDLFGFKPFDTPKPTSLLAWLIKLHQNERATVLDFFAGSASTAHAVMKVNAEDGGARRFIMIQLPEACDEDSPAKNAGLHTIADIGRHRIRLAVNSLQESAAITAGQTDRGFRSLRIDSSNMKDVFYSADEADPSLLGDHVDNIKDDRSDEDLLFQVLLDWGVDLSLPITKDEIGRKAVYFVDTNALAACFEDGIDEAFVKELAKREPLRAVFRDTGYGSDDVKINVKQIFKQLSPSTEVKTL